MQDGASRQPSTTSPSVGKQTRVGGVDPAGTTAPGTAPAGPAAVGTGELDVLAEEDEQTHDAAAAAQPSSGTGAAPASAPAAGKLPRLQLGKPGGGASAADGGAPANAAPTSNVVAPAAGKLPRLQLGKPGGGTIAAGSETPANAAPTSNIVGPASAAPTTGASASPAAAMSDASAARTGATEPVPASGPETMAMVTGAGRAPTAGSDAVHGASMHALTQGPAGHGALTTAHVAAAPAGGLVGGPAHGGAAHDGGHAAHDAHEAHHAAPTPHVATAPSATHVPSHELPGDHLSPKLAAASRKIQRSATAQKQAIQATSQAEQHGIVADGNAKAAQIEHAATAKINAILASIEQKRAAVSAAFVQARSSVKARTAAQKSTAQSEGQKALGDLRKLIADKQQAAKAGADKESKALEATGKTEADRARRETTTTVGAINSAASSAAGAAGGDADVQAAVQQAVNDAKADALTKAQKQGGDVAAKAEADARDGAQKIREGGDKLASELGGKSADVEKSVTDATKAAVDRIATIEQTNLKQLDELERKSLAALTAMKAKVAPPIRAAAARTANQARQGGQQAAHAVGEAEAAQSRAIDQAAQQAHSKLGALPHGEVDEAKLDHAVGALTGSFAQIHSQGAAAVGAEAAKVKTGLARSHDKLTANLDGVAAKLEAKVAQAVSGAHQGAAQVTAKVEADTKGAVDDMHQAHHKALTDYGTQLQQKIDEGNQGWVKKREDSERSIRDDVTKGIQGVIDVRGQIGPKLQEIAQKAKEKQDRPWWKKALSGIWEGIKSFVGGLLVFLAAVIVVALIALLFVSGIGEAIALALLIVGVAFLVVGFVMSLINRWGTLMERLRSGNYPWYAAFGLGVLTVLASAGDVIGVTPLIEGIVGHDAVSWKPLSAEERWKRGTIGALTILTILLLKRGNVKGGEEPPGAGDGLGGKKGGPPDPVGGRDGAPDPASGKGKTGEGDGAPDPASGKGKTGEGDAAPDPANGKGKTGEGDAAPDPANGKGKTGEGDGKGKTDGEGKTPEEAAAEAAAAAKQAKIDAELAAELKARGLENDPMFKDMDPQTRGKVNTALKNDPLAKAGDGVQDAALKWAKDGADGNPREFANRYEYARAKFNEVRDSLAPEYKGKPNGKNLLNEAAGKELSPERLAKDLAADNAASKAQGPGENLDMSKLPEKPTPDDIGKAVKGLERFGFESETAELYHAVKHQAELPEPRLADSPVENYDAYAKDTIKTGEVVKAERQPNGSTLVVIQKTYGGKVLEAILYIKPDGKVTLASYGKSKAISESSRR